MAPGVKLTEAGRPPKGDSLIVVAAGTSQRLSRKSPAKAKTKTGAMERKTIKSTFGVLTPGFGWTGSGGGMLISGILEILHRTDSLPDEDDGEGGRDDRKADGGIEDAEGQGEAFVDLLVRTSTGLGQTVHFLEQADVGYEIPVQIEEWDKAESDRLARGHRRDAILDGGPGAMKDERSKYRGGNGEDNAEDSPHGRIVAIDERGDGENRGDYQGDVVQDGENDQSGGGSARMIVHDFVT